jgi:hypothetical protein
MSIEHVALHFKMIVDVPVKAFVRDAAHMRYRTEGWIDTGLDEHLKTCAECRATLTKDLREFADQIEAMR